MKMIRTIHPTARKNHLCNYCNGTIQVGEKYENQTNVFDGAIYTWKGHIRCQKIMSELDMFDTYDEGVTGEDFHESIIAEFSAIDGPEGLDFQGKLDFVCKHYLKQ